MGRGEIEIEQTLGCTYIGGAELIGECSGIDEGSENLRQSMLGMFEKHHQSLHRAAAKRLRSYEARLQEKLEQNAKLEMLAELYKGEVERLLMRVRYLEHAAMLLSTGLKEANATRRYAKMEEEAESSFKDPDRMGPVRLDWKAYERELVTMMVWSYRHVCVCTHCNAANKCCPVCRVVKTTSVEVILPLE